MNTYVFLAPESARIDDWHADVRYVYATNAARARERVAKIWRCDREDCILLIAFKITCDALPTGRGSLKELREKVGI